jgi:hypothetical protein
MSPIITNVGDGNRETETHFGWWCPLFALRPQVVSPIRPAGAKRKPNTSRNVNEQA